MSNDNLNKLCNSSFYNEFKLADECCARYFDFMYKILQFSFAAIIAVVGIGFGFFNNNVKTSHYCALIFSYVLPICLYVFGTMYAYNAYGLSIYGKKAELLHRKLCAEDELYETLGATMNQYVITNRVVASIAYGVPLLFYIFMPCLSICFSCSIPGAIDALFWDHILAAIFYIAYVIIISLIIVPLVLNYRIIIKREDYPEKTVITILKL